MGEAERGAIILEKRRAAARSVGSGFLLTALKLAAGLATGSLGLMAEAAHSALDLAAAGMTWFAVRTSAKPPDEDHPYGHGKIEHLTALGETLLLVLTSLWILYEAARRVLGGGPEVEPSIAAFAVMAISIAVDIVRSRDLKRVAVRSGSQALEADALHFSTDIFSSAVVIAGLFGVVVARETGIEWLFLADPIAASLVAVIVLVLSWQLGRRAADMLLDRAPEWAAASVERALRGLEGLEKPPRARVRQSGDRILADVELTLRRGLPLAEGERIADQARARLREAFETGAVVTVALVASHEGAESLRQRVATAVAMEGVHAHNITLREAGGGTQADLHLELPGDLTLAEGHTIADRVEARILSEVPEIRRADIHLEQHDERATVAESLGEERRRDIERRIHEAARPIVGDHALHDLHLAETPAGVYLSCHCSVPAETSLADVHALTERLERAFRQAAPDLARVSVHAEPLGSPRHAGRGED